MDIKKTEDKKHNTTLLEQGGQSTSAPAKMRVFQRIASEHWDAMHLCDQQECETTDNDEETHESKQLTTQVEQYNTMHDNEQLEQ